MAADFDLPPSMEKNSIAFRKTDGLTWNPLRKKNSCHQWVYGHFWNSPKQTATICHWKVTFL